MDSGKRNLLIAVAVVAAIVAAGYVVHAMSGKKENGDEKAYMTAIKNQVQQKKPGKKFDKGEYMKNLDAKLRTAVEDGEMTAQEAEAKKAEVRQAIAKKKQAAGKKTQK